MSDKLNYKAGLAAARIPFIILDFESKLFRTEPRNNERQRWLNLDYNLKTPFYLHKLKAHDKYIMKMPWSPEGSLDEAVLDLCMRWCDRGSLSSVKLKDLNGIEQIYYDDASPIKRHSESYVQPDRKDLSFANTRKWLIEGKTIIIRLKTIAVKYKVIKDVVYSKIFYERDRIDFFDGVMTDDLLCYYNKNIHHYHYYVSKRAGYLSRDLGKHLPFELCLIVMSYGSN